MLCRHCHQPIDRRSTNRARWPHCDHVDCDWCSACVERKRREIDEQDARRRKKP